MNELITVYLMSIKMKSFHSMRPASEIERGKKGLKNKMKEIVPLKKCHS